MFGGVSAWTVAMAAIAAPALLLAALAWRNRGEPGARGYLATVVGIAVWSVLLAVREGPWVVRPPFVLDAAIILALYLAALGWVYLVYEYLKRRTVVPDRGPTALVLAVPVASVVLTATNGAHHLVFGPGTAVVAGQVEHVYGPWFYAHLGFVFVANVVSAAALARDGLAARGVHRKQALLLLVGWLVSFVGALDFLLVQVVAWLPEVEVSPLAFLLGACVWGTVLFRYQLFEIVPVGRTTAVETMPDAVVSLDPNGLVVDANPAARDLLDVDGDPTGTPVDAFFGDYPDLLDRYRGREHVDTEVSVVHHGETRHFSLTVTPIGTAEARTGTLVMLRDVTDLKERERDLKVLKQVLSRVLRHNMRNDLNVIKGTAERIPDADPDELDDLAADIVEVSDDLASTSANARRIERIIDQETRLVERDATATVERVVERLRDEDPDATITVDAPPDAPVRAHADVGVAIENLVENAVVHDPSHSTVDVTVAAAGESVLVTVDDDGPGIPEEELDAIRRSRETDLEHGSGAGLWLVDWVVRKSNGDLSFDVDGAGTTVQVRLQAASVDA
jgi:signal transduction histidine kinase